jgi:hypothetical protein
MLPSIVATAKAFVAISVSISADENNRLITAPDQQMIFDNAFAVASV